MSKPSLYEKALEMKELSTSLAIANKILSVMEATNNTMFLPWVQDMKQQIGAVESATGQFLLALTYHLPEEENSPNIQKRIVNRRRLSEIEVNTESPGYQATNEWSGDAEQEAFGYHTVPNSFDWKQENNLRAAAHGFGSKREYQKWKRESIRAHPHMKSFFNTLDDLEVDNFAGVHQRMLQMQNKLYSDLGGHASKGSRRRRLNIEKIGDQVSTGAEGNMPPSDCLPLLTQAATLYRYSAACSLAAQNLHRFMILYSTFSQSILI